MEKIQEKNNYIAQSLTGILDIIICLLLFISSIYKGAFYKSDFLFPNVVISVIGAIYLLYKIVKEIIRKNKDSRPRSKLKVLLDMFMLVLPITYFLPIIFKTYVSLPDSIFEMLRYANMTVIYFIVRSTKNEKVYLNIFVLIAVVQSLFGIDQLTFRNFEEFLNDLSTGYLPDSDRLSATLQYANITGIVIFFGMVICFSNLSNILEKEGKLKYIELIICVFLILLQFTAITLTESRVAVVVSVVLLLIDSIFSLICIDKKAGVYKLGLIGYSIVTSSILEILIINSEYSKIYICLILSAVLFVVVSILISIALKIINKKINIQNISKRLSRFNNKYIKIGLFILTVIILCIIFVIPKDLKVASNKGNIVEVQRNIYDVKAGKNTIKLEVEHLTENAEYFIRINKLENGYIPNNIVNFNNGKAENEFYFDFELDDNTRKLNVIIQVQKGEVKINELKLNDENVKLSYLFIPDSIAFKIKDTFYGVYGDSLRLEYAKDTFKLFKQSPIIGVGGEGFKHTYGSVQSTAYISSEAHSALLQSLVEVGIVGTTVFISIILLSLTLIIKLIIRLKKLSLDDKKYIVTLILMYFALLSIVIFDLALSYAFMIYVFGVVTALLLKAYIDIISNYNERKERQSKLDWSYIKIVILSLSAVMFFCASYFSINAYRASLIRLPNKGDELSVLEVAENIAYLELKVSQDKFDMDYMKDLNKEYNKYKVLVTQGYINTGNDKETRKQLNDELNNVIIKIKDNTDKMLEYEYYDKYVLNDVADIYIENYPSFASIYKQQFSSEEVAYSFYLNYALKLTDRIIELNPLSKKANELYYNMCKEYVEKLENDNKYLNSDAVSIAIQEFKERIKY